MANPDWNLIARAGLSPRDFAELVGVSRVTVWNWINGVCAPSQLVAGDAEHLLSVIDKRIKDGTLPLKLENTQTAARNERKRQVRMALS